MKYGMEDAVLWEKRRLGDAIDCAAPATRALMRNA